eukprot:5576971-Pleurochrysis_carterae.AAC.1
MLTSAETAFFLLHHACATNFAPACASCELRAHANKFRPCSGARSWCRLHALHQELPVCPSPFKLASCLLHVTLPLTHQTYPSNATAKQPRRHPCPYLVPTPRCLSGLASAAGIRGRRATMEDAHLVLQQLPPPVPNAAWPQLAVFAVYDGHAGACARDHAPHAGRTHHMPEAHATCQ